MTLQDKIKTIYPELLNEPWFLQGIIIQNDSDGKGDYIAKWEHPTLPRPTDDALGITSPTDKGQA
jgi:hypothetical protein